ncbi:MAG TPA: hypothetical protein VKA48_00240 [Gammaproteobacteria bacterium]|nr:hypothetical protein [Gammaproteobacteria bacterium]
MQWKHGLVLAAAVLIGSAGMAQAAMHEETGGGGTSEFQKYDTNGDGTVSLEEAQKAHNSDLSKNFKQYDQNGDNKLDQGEFARFEAEQGGHMQKKNNGMDEGEGD